MTHSADIDTTECERCEGTGDLYGRTFGPIALCPDCNGIGVIPPAVCPPCKGTVNAHRAGK